MSFSQRLCYYDSATPLLPLSFFFLLSSCEYMYVIQKNREKERTSQCGEVLILPHSFSSLIFFFVLAVRELHVLFLSAKKGRLNAHHLFILFFLSSVFLLAATSSDTSSTPCSFFIMIMLSCVLLLLCVCVCLYIHVCTRK